MYFRLMRTEPRNRPRHSWSAEAECRNAPNPDIFFPKNGRPKKVPDWRELCESCPVQRECLQWAIVHKAEGTWADTTTDDRLLLRKMPYGTTGENLGEVLTRRAKLDGWWEPDPTEAVTAYLKSREVQSEKRAVAETDTLPVVLDFELP